MVIWMCNSEDNPLFSIELSWLGIDSVAKFGEEDKGGKARARNSIDVTPRLCDRFNRAHTSTCGTPCCGDDIESLCARGLGLVRKSAITLLRDGKLDTLALWKSHQGLGLATLADDEHVGDACRELRRQRS